MRRILVCFSVVFVPFAAAAFRDQRTLHVHEAGSQGFTVIRARFWMNEVNECRNKRCVVSCSYSWTSALVEIERIMCFQHNDPGEEKARA